MCVFLHVCLKVLNKPCLSQWSGSIRNKPAALYPNTFQATYWSWQAQNRLVTVFYMLYAAQPSSQIASPWPAGTQTMCSYRYVIWSMKNIFAVALARQHAPGADGGSGSGTIVLCLACNPVSHHVNPLIPNPIMRCSCFIQLQGQRLVRLYKVLWCVTYVWVKSLQQDCYENTVLIYATEDHFWFPFLCFGTRKGKLL